MSIAVNSNFKQNKIKYDRYNDELEEYYGFVEDEIPHPDITA